MLLPITDIDGAELAARKILQDLEQPFLVDDRPLVVHGSIGDRRLPGARHHGRRAAAEGRRRDVRGEEQSLRLRGLRRRSRSPHRTAAGADDRAASRRSTGSSSCSTTSRLSDLRTDAGPRRRSAAALEPSGTGASAAGGIHPRGRAHRPDHAADRVLDRSRLSDWPTRQRPAADDCREPVAAKPARPDVPDAHPAHAGGARHRSLIAGARDHGEPDHVGPRSIDAVSDRAARHGHSADRRRLRHRILVAQLSAPAPRRRAEDRQVASSSASRAARTIRWCDRSSTWRTICG